MANDGNSSWAGPLATGIAGLVAGAALVAGTSHSTTTVTAPATTVTAAAATPAASEPAAEAERTKTADAPVSRSGALVKGTLSKDCGLIGGCTSPDAAAEFDADDVWCRWQGDHVGVHAVLSNGMNARVNVSIVPKYFIEKGGQHGTSFGSDIAVRLDPHETREWTGDAGRPEGVPSGTPISSCEPHLEDIDIS